MPGRAHALPRMGDSQWGSPRGDGVVVESPYGMRACEAPVAEIGGAIMAGVDYRGRSGDVPGYLSEFPVDFGDEVSRRVKIEGTHVRDVGRGDGMADGVGVWRSPGLATIVMVEDDVFPGTPDAFAVRPCSGLRTLVFDRGDEEFADEVAAAVERLPEGGGLDASRLVREVGRLPVSEGEVGFGGRRYVWGVGRNAVVGPDEAFFGRDAEVLLAVRRACLDPGLCYLAGRRGIEVPEGVSPDVVGDVDFRRGCYVLDVDGIPGSVSLDVDVPGTFATMDRVGVAVSCVPPGGRSGRDLVREGMRLSADMRDLGIVDAREMEVLAAAHASAPVREAPSFDGGSGRAAPSLEAGMRL